MLRKPISTPRFTEEVIPGKAPTCTETGLTEGKKCSVCGEILVAQEEIAALGHTEEIIPGKAPTCTETGLTEGKKCTVCGEITVAQEEIPALGHDFVNGECSRCDATLTSKFEDVPADAFYFDPVEWAVAKGITTGATETTFNPNGECQRALDKSSFKSFHTYTETKHHPRAKFQSKTYQANSLTTQEHNP